MICPRCGNECWRDEADVGVGVMYGPWGCPCGWSEDARFDVTGGPKTDHGYAVDQWGGLTPTSPPAYETVDDRCRSCSKKLLVDLGGTYFGEVDGPVFCPNCGIQPEACDWATQLRAALAQVKAERTLRGDL